MGGTITYKGTVGSMMISEFIIAQFSPGTTSTLAAAFRMRISGTAGLNMVTNTKNFSAGERFNTPANFTQVFTSGALTASGGNIGSDYVISIEGNDASSTAQGRVFDAVAWGF